MSGEGYKRVFGMVVCNKEGEKSQHRATEAWERVWSNKLLLKED